MGFAIDHLTTVMEKAVRELMRYAGIVPGSVDTVFFTGGSSGVPLLCERIVAAVPHVRKVEEQRFGSIGAGLALDAPRSSAKRVVRISGCSSLDL